MKPLTSRRPDSPYGSLRPLPTPSGGELAKFRTEGLEWSQEQLGRYLGVSRRTVGAWEDGTNRVPSWALDGLRRLMTAEKVDRRRGRWLCAPCPYVMGWVLEPGDEPVPALFVLEHMRDCPWCMARAVEAVTSNTTKETP